MRGALGQSCSAIIVITAVCHVKWPDTNRIVQTHDTHDASTVFTTHACIVQYTATRSQSTTRFVLKLCKRVWWCGVHNENGLRRRPVAVPVTRSSYHCRRRVHGRIGQRSWSDHLCSPHFHPIHGMYVQMPPIHATLSLHNRRITTTFNIYPPPLDRHSRYELCSLERDTCI